MSDYWQESMTSAQALRHELHQHPELSWRETRTAKRVREWLTALDIPWQSCADTGTLARLNPRGQSSPGSSGPGDKSGPHIALRGDMDALPITEQTGLDWSSTNSGCMHACGHDGHTATLLATARWLKHCEDRLPGPVTLLFQPAEEGGHGARKMIEEGALDGVDEIYGWHNWPAMEFGRVACPDSIVMCGNGTFSLTITGSGGHASQPELCRDPVLAASAITLALQQIVSRRLPPQRAAVVSVTSIVAPSLATVIPEKAVIGGSIRVPDRETRDLVNRLITEVSQQTASSYGVDCKVEISPRYDATINHPPQAEKVRQCWQKQRGQPAEQALDSQLPLPVMASEDFSYYLQQIPGAFTLIGADDGKGHGVPIHSSHYDFNDRLIPEVTGLFARLVGAPLP